MKVHDFSKHKVEIVKRGAHVERLVVDGEPWPTWLGRPISVYVSLLNHTLGGPVAVNAMCENGEVTFNVDNIELHDLGPIG